MSSEKEHKANRHWITITFGILVAAVFLVIIFSYQVKSTEFAVVNTLGKLSVEERAGLHPRWPYPIQSIYKLDRRIRCYEGVAGNLEETLTRNGQNVVIGIYITYKIDKPLEFYQKMVDISAAETFINGWMRSKTALVIGQYNFDQLVNTDPALIKLNEIEQKIRQDIQALAGERGLQIVSVGINTVNIPESTTKDVFDRMIAERNKVSTEYRSDGKSKAEEIKTLANRNAMNIRTDAEAEAKMIRAEGDANAAKFYAEFKRNPELAAFLRKLDSLRKVMNKKTTLILDTDSAPFDILKMGAEKIGEQKK